MDARLNDAAIHRTYSNSQRRAVLFNPLHFRLQATAPRFVVPTLVGGCDAEFGQRVAQIVAQMPAPEFAVVRPQRRLYRP